MEGGEWRKREEGRGRREEGGEGKGEKEVQVCMTIIVLHASIHSNLLSAAVGWGR